MSRCMKTSPIHIAFRLLPLSHFWRWLIVFVIGILPFSLAQAQTADPGLLATKNKYEADVATTNKARDNALDVARRPYLAALDAAEAKVTAAGNTTGLKAILDEKQSVNVGNPLATVPPSALPREAVPLRTNYLREQARLGVATALRLQQLQMAYLRELGLIELRARAISNASLIEQIGSEKLALTSEKIITAATAAIPKGKNAVLNGDFSQVASDGKPAGWAAPLTPRCVLKR